MLSKIAFLSSLEPWILNLILISVVAILANLLAKYLLAYARKVSEITSNIWDDALIDAAERPIVILIWLIAIKKITDALIKEFHNQEFVSTIIATKIAIILCFSWFLLRLIKNVSQGLIIERNGSDSDFDNTTIEAFAKLAKIAVFVVASLFILQDFGVSISGILAAGGAGGLVIGFAAKDMFANFFGGLTIYLDRPFNVGDWVRCDEKKIEGVVEYIGWRHTRLRGLNKNPIYVPNSVFTTVVVENPSRMTHRRIKETIGIRYADIDKMEKIISAVKNMIKNNDNIDDTQKNVVSFDSFGASSIDFSISVFTKVTDLQEYVKIKQDILLKIAKIINEHDAKIAFPTQSIYIENEQDN